MCEGSRPQPMEEVRDGDTVEEEEFEYEEEFEVSSGKNNVCAC